MPRDLASWQGLGSQQQLVVGGLEDVQGGNVGEDGAGAITQNLLALGGAQKITFDLKLLPPETFETLLGQMAPY
ncbi:hypothetical protein A3747_16045 [Sulfitobacter sp. HI0076]|nr:hypothetical protein A3720_16620 [Sulfitobacter sp. HI0021]KZY01627.1 hypothetical protein A3722_07895 [Sulfitobacter sp. HI0027]KZZ02297.1 hypothetical protein A3747_16045 [Sulfitobacter sp. HI0076]